MSSIKWLCGVAGKEAFAAQSAAVVAVPNVPWAAVCMLTAAGVRPTDAAVKAAALKQQPGAEAWLCARLQLPPLTASLAAQLRSPAGTLYESTARAAAYSADRQDPLLGLLDLFKVDGPGVGVPWHMYFMHPSHMPDLLRIAVNQQDAAAATANAEYLVCSDSQLCERASGPLQDALLLYRMSLLDDQARTQQYDAASILRWILQWKQAEKEQLLANRSAQLQQVSPQLLDELLLLAVARQHSRLIGQLLKMPALQQLQSSTVAALLHHAI
uniref:Uncharacterized protein n=1 Tax=Tetradesmus obliquus TaxID=3088 RepID=A0A383V3P5_TETOB|eukprot:jgi/Sobl393_1/7772/SZX59540.1